MAGGEALTSNFSGTHGHARVRSEYCVLGAPKRLVRLTLMMWSIGLSYARLRVLLELGVNVLYADIDAVWTDSPLPDLGGGDYDIWIQADADSPNVSLCAPPPP